MTSRIARCACGALAASAEGEPIRISVCHCLECKRRTGSAFSWNAHWPEDQVSIEGDRASYGRSSDDGHWVLQHFCPTCGTMVFYEIERRPGIVSIPVGVFADLSFLAPAVEVYEERRCSWLPLLAPVEE
jgi:hypothetical protein